MGKKTGDIYNPGAGSFTNTGRIGGDIKIGLNKEQTTELVGKEVEEKIAPIAQTIFDTQNTLEALNKTVRTIAKEIESGDNGYRDFLKAGWSYLCCGDFKTALYEFKNALSCDQSGHEAHFGFALATHKIQLLDIGRTSTDSNKFNKIPIYYEIANDLYIEDAFERDPHYEKAIEYSQEFPEIQNKYKDCAQKIKDIINAFHSYSSRQYDCFICAKVTELDKDGKPIEGTKTDDCKWAMGLHSVLNKEKLNPFFSECDIGEQVQEAATKYEALILYALVHCKCMIIVCSKQEYYNNSIYIQNEYNRFVGFLKERNRGLDNIYLIRKEKNISLPFKGETQDRIRSSDEKSYHKDYQKVAEYANLKVKGKVADRSSKKYCINCNKSYDKNDDNNVCSKCDIPLVSFDEYETVQYNKLDEDRLEVSEAKKDLEEQQKTIEKTAALAKQAVQEAQQQAADAKQETAAANARATAAEQEAAEANERAAAAEQEAAEANARAAAAERKVSISQEDNIVLEALEDIKIPEGLSKKIKRLYKSAKASSSKAQLELGNCYYSGKDVERDNNEAVKWFYRAEKSGNVRAKYMLGECFKNGQGVKKDESKAVNWYREAAESGYAPAQYELGRMYYDGIGVSKNHKETIKWYRKAAIRGFKAACDELATCNSWGDTSLISTKEATKWKCFSQIRKSSPYLLDILLLVCAGLLVCSTVLGFIMLIVYSAEAILPATSGQIWIAVVCLFGICLIYGVIYIILLCTHFHGVGKLISNIVDWISNLYERISTKLGEWVWIPSAVFLIGLAGAVLLVPVLSIITPAFHLESYDFAYRGILYDMQEDGTLVACYSESNVKDVIIPYEIDGHKVTKIDSNMLHYTNEDKIKSITIEADLASIDGYAFRWCENLESATIPTNVISYLPKANLKSLVITSGESISSSAFKDCENLKNITIADSIISIGKDAFTGTAYYNNESNWQDNVLYIGNHLIDAKTDISGSYSVKQGTLTIGPAAFHGCVGLEDISIPDSVTSIGADAFTGTAFYNNENNWQDSVLYIGNRLIDVNTDISGECTIKQGTVTIPNNAFYGCSNLTGIAIPDSVISIGDYAFYNCSSLTSLTIPDSVTSIGGSAFSYCNNIESLTIPAFAIPCFSKSKLKTVVITSGASIESDAFKNCANLENIVISDSITTVGDNAFNGCSSLKNITIPDSVISIGSSAFSGCINLESATIPAFAISYLLKVNLKEVVITSGESIDDQSFIGCTKLESILINDGITIIGDYAFFYCVSLASITIPDSVTSIGSSAFDGCTNLESATIPTIAISFIPKTKLKTLVITSGESIASSAFKNCKNLEEITIADSITSIGTDAFTGTAYYNNENNWQENVLYIGNHLIKAKSVLSGSYTIKAGTFTISDYAFNFCSALTSIIIPDSVTSIGDYAFYFCGKLTSIIIPDSVTSIGDSAFDCCSSLISIIIPDSVTSIGRSAFWGCSSLTNITIPDSVISIGRYAFEGCSSLTNITIPDSVISIGYGVFYSCYNLKTIYCEHSEKPSDWDNGWLRNCEAEVIWGYKDNS